MGKRRAVAAKQVERITRMVAELSRVAAVGDGEVPVHKVAKLVGTTEQQIFKDLRVLSEAADDPTQSGLASLSMYQEGDRIYVSSQGAFRRPIRFTAEELLALKVAVATETEELSAGLRTLLQLEPEDALPQSIPYVVGEEAAVVNLFRGAVQEQRKVRIEYVSAHDHEASMRVVHPYEIINARGHFYLAGWCETRDDWRMRFRADRVLAIELLEDRFDRRDDAPLIEAREDLFAAPDEVDEVTVRFSSEVARWMRERYPTAEDGDDGSVMVTFQVASVDWLVNHVLQYGADAEVVGPAAYREAVRRAVGASPPAGTLPRL